MTISAITPYLIVPGRAREAISVYERAFDAKVQNLQRFGDVDQSCADAVKDHVMHAELKIGNALLMISDGAKEPPTGCGPVKVAIALDDVAQAERAFEVLAQGGTTLEPLKQAPWGALFGMVNDVFGISWMFNVTQG